MGKAKRTKKFASMKRMLSLKDSRINKKDREKKKKKKGKKQKKDGESNKKDREKKKKKKGKKQKKDAVSTEVRSVNMQNVRHVPKTSSAMFFKYNTQLGPPYHVLVDTNFINFSLKNKIDIFQGLMDCLYAKCVPYITDCVMAELEKLGSKYNVALRIVKDDRFQRLPCIHKGTYADDCLVQRVMQHKCYIVATCDKDLKRRIRKIPGVPIMFLQERRFAIERLPDAFGAPNT